MQLKTYHQQLLIDTLTPVSAYLTLRDHFHNSILLESSDYNTRQGNYSFIACKPLTNFKAAISEIQILFDNKLERKKLVRDNFKTDLQEYISSHQTEPIDVNFPYSAVFGYSSFDIISVVEDIELQHSKDPLIPIANYSFYSLLLVFDHSLNQLHIVSFSDDRRTAIAQANELIKTIQISNHPTYSFETIGEIESNLNDETYLENVEKAKTHCKYGDVFQMVLSKRFSQKFIGDEFNVYRTLKQINPSPYLFYFDLGDFKLFGSSPEAQLVVKNGIAEIHPIAGTYKRTRNTKEDLSSIEKLKQDPKENSEHMMLVDLARNDLSRNCSNVKVETLKQAQLYSHVIHLVSKVTGQLKKENTSLDLLYSSFPAGTLSGAPKHKALQLIDAYEQEARNFYGGCIGFIETNGNINKAIMIRSFLSIQNTLHFQAGAGIVVDSKAENELNEVYNKINALKKALKEAQTLNNITTFA